MINLKTDIPIKQDLFESLQDTFAQIRDLLLEAEEKIAFAKTAGDFFMTKKELAEYLRCEPKNIPRGIPRMRRGNDLLFKKSDIDNYVKSKTK